MEHEVKIFVSTDKLSSFIWNADDVHYLREKHRIVGTLIGCLPRAPKQSVHLGLPLRLLPEEVTLLAEKGIGHLVSDEIVTEKPTTTHIEIYEKIKKNSYVEQTELFREERRQEIIRNLPNITEGRKAKRKKLLDERKGKGEDIDDAEYEKDIEVNVEDIVIPKVPIESTMTQLFTDTPWEVNHCKKVEWKFPHTEEEKLRYKVFKDLWEKGYFLTLGNKFGGDFLVYPGDPARFHSFFIAICMPADKKMSALDIVSMGRLGSNVKKSVLLCSVDMNQSVIYTSLQWTGIS